MALALAAVSVGVVASAAVTAVLNEKSVSTSPSMMEIVIVSMILDVTVKKVRAGFLPKIAAAMRPGEK